MPDVSKESLKGFIKENIELGATVITDGWSRYVSIDKCGYQHIVPKKFENAAEENILLHVRMIVSLFKR